MIRERRNMVGGFKSHNADPCPSCLMWNKKDKKCEPVKGCYCKQLRNVI